MPNPRSLVHVLHTHWYAVETLVRMSREFTVFTTDQVLASLTKVSPQLNAEDQSTILRALVNADILQTLPRSSDLQINTYVLEFVRSLTHEHEMGLAAVLQARIAAISEATLALNEGVATADMDRVRTEAAKLAELFRQIRLQLDQDRHAILEDTRATVLYYGGHLDGRLLAWLSAKPRAREVILFADYDGVGLANFLRLHKALSGNCTSWLMPDWDKKLMRYGNSRLWQSTLREFPHPSIQLPDALRQLAERMRELGLALEQEAVWLPVPE